MSTIEPLPSLAALDRVIIFAGDADHHADTNVCVIFAEEYPQSACGYDQETLERMGASSTLLTAFEIYRGNGQDAVIIGGGSRAELTTSRLRDIAATAVRTAKRASHLSIVIGGELPTGAARAMAEGVLLAAYRYDVHQSAAKVAPLRSVSIPVEQTSANLGKLSEARVNARSTVVARDLANMPPNYLTATDMAAHATALGAQFGFDVEAFDKKALTEMGCGGLLAVNQGSAEEPRLIRLRYRPESDPVSHLGMVGKGIMYDSGGISLKPSDPMHLLMKLDMGGAAAILGAFCGFRDRDVNVAVTGWLACTDNMPSVSAYRLGDVVTARGGTTIEIKNTDAEGRFAMSDSFVLANEEGVDAIIDIATLTGASLMALGQRRAPFFSNDETIAALVTASSETTDEAAWRFPLEPSYRPQLDSIIADISNLGGAFAGATTAALFIQHFVGDTPWAHIDIAGTMHADKDDAWRTRGATGYGARLLLQAAVDFEPGQDAEANS